MSAQLKQIPAFRIEVLKFKAMHGNDGQIVNATIAVNGHKLDVLDDGNGGCLQFRASHPYGRAPNARELADEKAALDALDAEAKRIGTITSDLTNGDGTPFTYECDDEHLVNDAFAKFQSARDLTRALKTKVLFTTPGKGKPNAVWQVSLKQRGKVWPLNEAVAAVRKQHGADTVVLNLLPFDDALALYTKF